MKSVTARLEQWLREALARVKEAQAQLAEVQRALQRRALARYAAVGIDTGPAAADQRIHASNESELLRDKEDPMTRAAASHELTRRRAAARFKYHGESDTPGKHLFYMQPYGEPYDFALGILPQPAPNSYWYLEEDGGVITWFARASPPRQLASMAFQRLSSEFGHAGT